MKDVIYLSKKIRKVWEKYGEKDMLEFLESGRDLFIDHAKMKPSARKFLADHPGIRRCFES